MDKDISIGNKEIYLFGPFRVDATERLLFKNNSLVPLSGNTFDLLLALVRSSGHLKSRRELIRTVWPDTIVEESNLTWNVTALRQALGDDSHAPRYVETVRGHGYRFSAPVTTPSAEPADRGSDSAGAGAASAAIPSGGGPIAAEAAPTTGAGNESETKAVGASLLAKADAANGKIASKLAPTRVVWMAGGVTALVVALALTWYFAFYRPAPMAAPGPSIAVLPFENLSPGHADAWFAAGIQDTILSKLAGIGQLRVVSRTSSERYPSRPTGLRRVAAQLGVSSVLEGSVQKLGNQVLINVQLIDARNNDHIWGQSYTRPVTDLFAVENNIATRVVSALQTKLLPHEAARLAKAPTHNTQAYLLFLKANYYADQITKKSSAKNFTEVANQAIELYHQAVTRDARFALAWARLSLLESNLYYTKHSPSLKAAKDAAQRALVLAPDLPQAHLAKGHIEYLESRNNTAALAQFKQALEGAPNNAAIIETIAIAHFRQGKWQQAFTEMQRAMALDPRNPARPFTIGYNLMALRKYHKAGQLFDRALALEPHDYDAKTMKLMILFLAGNPLRQIQEELAKIHGHHLERGLVTALQFWAAALNRQPKTALAAIAKAPDWIAAPNAFGREPTSLLRARAWAALGNQVQAQQAYEKAHGLLLKALRERPKDPSLWSFLGLTEAGLGHKRKAIQAGKKAVSLVPVSKNVIDGPSFLLSLAKIYARTGESEQAIKLLRRLLAMPAGLFISVPLLERDPVWDPLRKNPAFQKLIKEYANKPPPPASRTRQ